jgi:hypothetical protein
MLSLSLSLWQWVTSAAAVGTDPLAPAAPTIDMQTASDLGDSSTDNITSDTTPTFDVNLPSGFGDAQDAADGDTLVLQIADSGGFNQDVTDPLDAGDVATDIIPLTPTALSAGVYYARARVERTGHNGPWTPALTFYIGDDTAPTISSSASVSADDDATLAHSLTADQTVTWTITGGVDSSHFEISGSTLRWAGNGTRDFDNPTDSGVNNTYVVDVLATNNTGLTDSQTITVTVSVPGLTDDILIETGDHLLLETGDLMLME